MVWRAYGQCVCGQSSAGQGSQWVKRIGYVEEEKGHTDEGGVMAGFC